MTDESRPARRRALITGASRGIGAALARTAPSDMDLLLVGRDADALEAVAEAERSAGRSVDIHAVDIANPQGRASLIEDAADRIDVLVNNAGLGAWGDFLKVEPTAHEAAVAVNMAAPTALMRGLLPGMIARSRMMGRRGGLINMASSVAFAPVPSFAVYAASKAYLLSLTEALTAELRREPIDVMTVCPGAVATEFGERAGFGGSIPGAMTPEHVAARSWAALGHRRTLVLGPVDKALFTPAALARATAAEVAARGAKLAGMFNGRR